MNEELVLEDKIISSAKRVFLEKGFEKAKMQEIADTAGISRTALNYYFRTKDNLFYSIVNQIFDGLLPHFEQNFEFEETSEPHCLQKFNCIIFSPHS